MGGEHLSHLDTIVDPVLASELPTALWCARGHERGVEALLGTDVAFAAAYQLARPHPGQIAVAAELRHLLRDSGLLSRTITVSPMWASLRSSCACRVLEVRTIFLYSRWRRVTSSRTVMVLSARSETTTPWRVFCLPGPCSRGGVVSTGVLCSARLARSLRRRDRRDAALWRRSSTRAVWRSTPTSSSARSRHGPPASRARTWRTW